MIEHIELDKGLDMVDKAGIGEKNELVRNDLVMKQTKNILKKCFYVVHCEMSILFGLILYGT